MNYMDETYTQQKKSKLLKGILWGAAAGAAISMLDKNTRESVMECGRKGFLKTKSAIQNPSQVIEGIKDTSENIIDTMESLSDDITFIASKIQELKGIPNQVSSVVTETKETLANSVGEVSK